ncbi:MAG: hypothetical protein ACRD7E_17260, partial [Bryobacteraceae bacterium]
RDPLRHTGGKRPRRSKNLRAQPELNGKNVRRAAGQNGKGHFRARHAVQHLIDGSVSAGRNDQISARFNTRARKLRSRARTGGRERSDAMPAPCQNIQNTVEDSISLPLQLAGEGIVDQICVLIGCNKPLVLSAPLL